MAQYNVSGATILGQNISVTTTTAGAVLFELIAGPTDQPVITEVYVAIGTPTGSVVACAGIGVPTAQGIGPIAGNQGPSSNYRGDNAHPTALILANMWQVQPTPPARYFRRISSSSSGPGSIPIIFRFPRGLKLMPSTSLIINLPVALAAGRNAFAECNVEFDV